MDGHPEANAAFWPGQSLGMCNRLSVGPWGFSAESHWRNQLGKP